MDRAIVEKALAEASAMDECHSYCDAGATVEQCRIAVDALDALDAALARIAELEAERRVADAETAPMVLPGEQRPLVGAEVSDIDLDKLESLARAEMACQGSFEANHKARLDYEAATEPSTILALIERLRTADRAVSAGMASFALGGDSGIAAAKAVRAALRGEGEG